jgi:hypothetical protein
VKAKLSKKDFNRSLRLIVQCDYLFDGKDSDGKYTGKVGDKEFAYNSLRHLLYELLEKFES